MQVQPASDPEKDAKQVLEQSWHPFGSDSVLPIDAIRIARSLGIDVYVANLPENESGRLINKPPDDPAIYLNQRDSRTRQVFTCAHEIGHFLRRVAAGEKEFAFYDKRDLVSAQGTDPEEIYANQFAAALLMPRSVLTQHFKKMPNPAILASRFGVSAEAMNYRLRNLGIQPG